MVYKLIVRKQLLGFFFSYFILNREIMNEEYHSFYIDSLEVFAIQK